MTDDQSYAGKSAYRGHVALNYERDRVKEPVWQQEQAWMERWAESIPAGARVLDVPTGTGRFVGIFRGRGAKVHAVDVSEDMLAELRRRFPPDGDNLLVEHGDAEALSYPAAMFDVVVCWRLFHLLPRSAVGRVLRELARVCRGRIVVEVFGVEFGSVVKARLRALRRLLGKLARRRPEIGGAPWSHIANYAHREGDLCALFAGCGLRVIGIETLAYDRGAPARVYILERREEVQ
jgi:SAM-dependent methyltransferase